MGLFDSVKSLFKKTSAVAAKEAAELAE
ncbi:MAG: hypothetical protein RL068_593, partial [Actinomycetota bacterium]